MLTIADLLWRCNNNNRAVPSLYFNLCLNVTLDILSSSFLFISFRNNCVCVLRIYCCLDIAGTSHNLDIGNKQCINILNVLFLVFSYIRNMICAHVISKNKIDGEYRTNCLPFRNTWDHKSLLVRSCCSISSFCAVFYLPLFIFLL